MLSWREISRYTLIMALASIASIGIRNIDTMLIGSFIGLEQVAVYSIAFMIGAIIETPVNALSKIADSKISNAIKENNQEQLTGWTKFRQRRAEKKQQRRLPKDQRVKTKFNLKNFNLPELPTLPNLPSIPTLPKKISLANLNQLPGFGKLPNISGLVAQGRGIVSGIGNINLKDPLSLLNAPANILNQVGGLANNVSSTLESTRQNILNSPTNKAAAEQREQVAIENQQRINETLADLKAKGDAALKKTLSQGLDNSTLTRTILKDRNGTIQIGTTTTAASSG